MVLVFFTLHHRWHGNSWLLRRRPASLTTPNQCRCHACLGQEAGHDCRLISADHLRIEFGIRNQLFAHYLEKTLPQRSRIARNLVITSQL